MLAEAYVFAGNQPFSGFCVVLNIALDDWSVKYFQNQFCGFEE